MAAGTKCPQQQRKQRSRPPGTTPEPGVSVLATAGVGAVLRPKAHTHAPLQAPCTAQGPRWPTALDLRRELPGSRCRRGHLPACWALILARSPGSQHPGPAQQSQHRLLADECPVEMTPSTAQCPWGLSSSNGPTTHFHPTGHRDASPLLSAL